MRTRRVDFLLHSLVIAWIDGSIFLNAYPIGIDAGEASHSNVRSTCERSHGVPVV